MFVRFTPVMKERGAYIKEALHVLMLMDVIQMISGFVVRLQLGPNILAIAVSLLIFTLPDVTIIIIPLT